MKNNKIRNPYTKIFNQKKRAPPELPHVLLFFFLVSQVEESEHIFRLSDYAHSTTYSARSN